mmetsp:Transcript_1100/g.1436  ORF Transcript_1100/g.1436 Transcript_1100/m.1436 type:complete len:223 (-) Transcript_1100:7428-8096(-)
MCGRPKSTLEKRIQSGAGGCCCCTAATELLLLLAPLFFRCPLLLLLLSVFSLTRTDLVSAVHTVLAGSLVKGSQKALTCRFCHTNGVLQAGASTAAGPARASRACMTRGCSKASSAEGLATSALTCLRALASVCERSNTHNRPTRWKSRVARACGASRDPNLPNVCTNTADSGGTETEVAGAALGSLEGALAVLGGLGGGMCRQETQSCRDSLPPLWPLTPL